MAKLDEKLGEAFKALGGRKDGLGWKEAVVSSLDNKYLDLNRLYNAREGGHIHDALRHLHPDHFLHVRVC